MESDSGGSGGKGRTRSGGRSRSDEGSLYEQYKGYSTCVALTTSRVFSLHFTASLMDQFDGPVSDGRSFRHVRFDELLPPAKKHLLVPESNR